MKYRASLNDSMHDGDMFIVVFNIMFQSLIIERISKGMLLNKLHFVNFNPFRRMAIHERTFGTFFMF